MDYTCLVGTSALDDFAPWWESHLPAWLILYCREGEAQLTLQFKSYTFAKGMMSVVSPDMFPAIAARSDDFRAFYCLVDRDFAYQSFFDTLPNCFYDAIYIHPLLPAGDAVQAWMSLMASACADAGNDFRKAILGDLLHIFVLDYYNRWRQLYGDRPQQADRSAAEDLCVRFYDLVFDHFRDHRNTAFYADKLCISSCYLAMVTRQVCGETPKEAIDRQVTLEMKYVLRNTTMTTKQIAAYLHFPDTSYMCRFFRRQTGYSLSGYRKVVGSQNGDI